MRAIIIEDEKPAARSLARILDNQGVKIEAMLHSVEDAINWIAANEQPDLGFFDIRLGDGLSFEIFDALNIDFPVVFTTAYDEYAIKAFKVNSIDYLLKPIDEDELEGALGKYHKLKKNNNQIQNFDKIAKLLSPTDYKKRFTIKIGRKIKLINSGDIACFYSKDKATYIKTKDNKTHMIDYPLDKLVKMLDPELFFRISRQFIIEADSIEEIYAYSNSRLGIKLSGINIDDIIVSREKVKSFKEWLEK